VVLPDYGLSVQPLLPDSDDFYRLIVGLEENIITPARKDIKTVLREEMKVSPITV
jgi:hypothetical protein